MRLHVPAIIVGVSLLVGIRAPVRAQALAELARKAEENRKNAKKGTRVYTNADAGNVPAATSAHASDDKSAASAGNAVAKAAEKPDGDARQDEEPQKDQSY